MLDPALDLRLSAIEAGQQRFDAELARMRGELEEIKARPGADGRALAAAVDIDELQGRMAEAAAR